jgi:hypothetical protein
MQAAEDRLGNDTGAARQAVPVRLLRGRDSVVRFRHGTEC